MLSPQEVAGALGGRLDRALAASQAASEAGEADRMACFQAALPEYGVAVQQARAWADKIQLDWSLQGEQWYRTGGQSHQEQADLQALVDATGKAARLATTAEGCGGLPQRVGCRYQIVPEDHDFGPPRDPRESGREGRGMDDSIVP